MFIFVASSVLCTFAFYFVVILELGLLFCCAWLLSCVVSFTFSGSLVTFLGFSALWGAFFVGFLLFCFPFGCGVCSWLYSVGVWVYLYLCPFGFLWGGLIVLWFCF